ncbi:MAG: hypothetical protein LVR00_09600 [Rhabdochlamydiaceae bacterium]|jgi:hypothetical protein
MNPRSSEISFMKEILPNLAHVFFTSLQFFQLQSAAGKGAFYDKASGYMEAGYPYVRILLSFVILKSIPQHEVGRRIPFFLADILLLGDAFAKVAGQFTIRKLSPLPPAPIGMAFRVAHVRALFFNLNIFMGADNLFSKTASIFSVFASGDVFCMETCKSFHLCCAGYRRNC